MNPPFPSPRAARSIGSLVEIERRRIGWLLSFLVNLFSGWILNEALTSPKYKISQSHGGIRRLLSACTVPTNVMPRGKENVSCTSMLNAIFLTRLVSLVEAAGEGARSTQATPATAWLLPRSRFHCIWPGAGHFARNRGVSDSYLRRRDAGSLLLPASYPALRGDLLACNRSRQ